MVGLGVVLLTSGELVVVQGELSEQLAEVIDLKEMVESIVRVILAAEILFTMWDILKGLKMWRGGYVIADAPNRASTD